MYPIQIDTLICSSKAPGQTTMMTRQTQKLQMRSTKMNGTLPFVSCFSAIRIERWPIAYSMIVRLLLLKMSNTYLSFAFWEHFARSLQESLSLYNLLKKMSLSFQKYRSSVLNSHTPTKHSKPRPSKTLSQTIKWICKERRSRCFLIWVLLRCMWMGFAKIEVRK